MIVPMKKVSLFVMDKDKETALDRVREIGVLHLERKAVESERLSALLAEKARAETAVAILDNFAPKKAAKGGVAALSSSAADIVDRVVSLSEHRKALQESISAATKELSRIEKWGDYKPGDFADLSEHGLTLTPYELTVSAYKELGDTPVIVLSREKTMVRALAVAATIESATPFVLPEKSYGEIVAAVGDAEDEIVEIDRALTENAPYRAAIKTMIGETVKKIEFESAASGMEADGGASVSWITGYAPTDTLGVLKRAASENGWAVWADDPDYDDEKVPTKLKNNRFASLIYPLTDFLEVVPGYREVDVSGWFLLFFCVFFGMIFGDAGYGTLLLIIALVSVAKSAKKGVPAALKMFLLLSVSNVIWGVLTCSWFGMDTTLLPSLLRNISLPQISNAAAAESATAKAIVDQNLMLFCFSLALLQLGIGHIIGILRNIRSLKLFADLGSLGMLAGMYNLVISLVVSNDVRKIPFLDISLYILIGGFVLNFMFAAYEGNMGKSILESVKNIIPTVLGVTNVFSDIMSYIRLWAVGLAGSSISLVVNSMAGPLLGSFLIFAGILLLVFGHGLNMILNVLSVLVHGVRLNTLEFSGHLGLTWSGTAYKPFKR
jgi:V/A-type H+-transporting ATPase subunit I